MAEQPRYLTVTGQTVQLEPQHYGAKFRRVELNQRSPHYHEAGRRYVRRWNRLRGQLVKNVVVELDREASMRCWYVYVYWDAAELPRG